MRTSIGAIIVAATLAAPASAAADKVIEAQTVWHFDAMRYVLDPGDRLVFKNDDSGSPGPHNVTSSQKGPDGKPLFASQTIRNGEQSVVQGASQLPAGSYDFICTVHPFMKATLVVGSGGSSPSSPSSPGPAQPANRPHVRARLGRVTRRARRLIATVRADRRVALDLSAIARNGRRTVSLGKLRATDASPGRSVRFGIRLGSRARRALRHARHWTVTLLVEARDDANRLTTVKASRRL